MFWLLVGTVTLAITTSRFYHAFQAVKPSVPLWLNLPVDLVFFCLLVPAHHVLTIFWGGYVLAYGFLVLEKKKEYRLFPRFE